MNWYDYPITVPFDDPNFDVGYGGSHDMDIGTPPNTPITALLSGEVVSLTSPSWGMQIGIKLETPYNGIPYMAYLHLSAASPALHLGAWIQSPQVIGWSGGCTQASQYNGTSNPTGHNFLNDPSQSSQPQTGLALMRGPEYGEGAGWTTKPDPALNPTGIITTARQKGNISHMEQQMLDIWNMFLEGIGEPTASYDTGIARSWKGNYQQMIAGSPMGPEKKSVNWNGQAVMIQYFTGGIRCEWNEIDGRARWYNYHNQQVA